MTKSCNLCGTTTDLMKCKKCKSVYYCTRECQVEDWQDHKTICKRKEFAGAPCDACQDTEEQCADVCHECGFIFCHVCHDKMVLRDHQGEEISFGSCPGCETPRRVCQPTEYKKKLEKLIKEKKGDPREARWVVKLGSVYQHEEMNDHMAKKCYLSAGELGLGEGYSRLAEMDTEQGEWDEARRYFRKAADRMDVIAIHTLGIDAWAGSFHSPDGRKSPRRPPDSNEAFRLFREGASLGDVDCYYGLGCCFLFGQGTTENLEKAFKWFQKAAEKGHVEAMLWCGKYYLSIEQSDAQAKYWLEKILESEKASDEKKKLARELLRTHNLC